MSDLTAERAKEIGDLLAELSTYWYEHPQLRLGQILVNVGPRGVDPFYVLDAHYRAALAAANREPEATP